MLFGLDWYEPAGLRTWVLRSESIEASVAAASAVGVQLGSISGGERVKPTGTVVSWKLTDPTTLPLNGAVPFLIDWGTTPAPLARCRKPVNLSGSGSSTPNRNVSGRPSTRPARRPMFASASNSS